jgi:hypothetical protein
VKEEEVNRQEPDDQADINPSPHGLSVAAGAVAAERGSTRGRGVRQGSGDFDRRRQCRPGSRQWARITRVLCDRLDGFKTRGLVALPTYGESAHSRLRPTAERCSVPAWARMIASD